MPNQIEAPRYAPMIKNPKIRFLIAGLLLVRALASVAEVVTVNAPQGFMDIAGPFVPLQSLKKAPNPVLMKDPVSGTNTLRPDLAEYVSDLSSAIQLGKALFWDMQVGSDNRTACATCHFQAGADVRAGRGQLAAGFNRRRELPSTNDALLGADFPLAVGGSNVDDVFGSQGVRRQSFVSVRPSKPDFTGIDALHASARDITDRNAPSVINSVYNHRNFYDGRAQPDFNGHNHLGSREPGARLWVATGGGVPVPVTVLISNASLASQAVAPPVSGTEMSAAGRSFTDLARKLFQLRPLASQQVSREDSVLGKLAHPQTGLDIGYEDLVRRAFVTKWWNATLPVVDGGRTNTLAAANFSMFFGLSLMLYEATLVSDDTPIDRYFDAGRKDLRPLDLAAQRVSQYYPGITAGNITNGLALFEEDLPPFGKGVGCIACHAGMETTSASVRALTSGGLEPGDLVAKNTGFDLRMERMFSLFPPVPPGVEQLVFDNLTYRVKATRSNGEALSPPAAIPVGVYDAGWYNIGVRPSYEDLGVGSFDPSGNPLSWSKYLQYSAQPNLIKVPGGALPMAGAGTAVFTNQVVNPAGFPLLSGPLKRSECVVVAGAFKTPSLRNVELTGPYFHTGGKSTLRQVMSFYKRGGDFDNPEKAPLIRPLDLSNSEIIDLIAFLICLTDERVLMEKAPFDHPQLFIPDSSAANSPGQNKDIIIELPAVGAAGALLPLKPFLGENPFRL